MNDVQLTHFFAEFDKASDALIESLRAGAQQFVDSLQRLDREYPEIPDNAKHVLEMKFTLLAQRAEEALDTVEASLR